MASILKKLLGSPVEDTSDYIEVDVGREMPRKSKIVLRPFVLKTFEDTNRILEVMREGCTIALVDIKPLKTKDVVELKRAVSKLKKTVDALEGNIAGFGENIIIATPPFVDIFKASMPAPKAPPEAA
jgi:SepF-like predicted cell division protein (DUF552 family)